MSKRFASRALIVIGIVGMLLALAMAFGAAFSFKVGGIRLHASGPMRPLLVTAVAAGAAVLASGPGSARRLGIGLGVIACTEIAALRFVRGNALEYAIGDAAFLELYTLHVTRGVWALGPYSQFGWHHPGPLYFYLLAPLYAAGGFRFAAINAGAAIINLTSLTVLLVIIGRSSRRSFVLWVPVVLGLYMLRLSPMFVSAWNPHVLVLPTAALVVVSAALASGQLSLAPFSIVIGSFCVQTHVALVPCVAALWAFTSVVIAIRTRLGEIETSAARKWLNVAIWTWAVCWLLPLAEQLQNRPGNMTAIIQFFSGSQPLQSFLDSLVIWSQMISGSIINRLTIPYARPLPVTPSLLVISLALAQPVLLLFATGRAMREHRIFEASLCGAGTLAAVVALWSVTRVTVIVEDYHVFWVSVVGALNWAMLAAVATDGLIERLFKWSPRRLASVIYPVFVIVVAYQPIRTLGLTDRLATSGDRIGKQIKASADAIAFDVFDHGFHRAIVRCGNEAWSEHAGVVVELYKRRVPVAVDQESLFMFGKPLALDGRETVEYSVHRTSAYEPENDLPGTDVMLRQADVTVTRRACTGPDVSRPCLHQLFDRRAFEDLRVARDEPHHYRALALNSRSASRAAATCRRYCAGATRTNRS